MDHMLSMESSGRTENNSQHLFTVTLTCGGKQSQIRGCSANHQDHPPPTRSRHGGVFVIVIPFNGTILDQTVSGFSTKHLPYAFKSVKNLCCIYVRIKGEWKYVRKWVSC